MSATPLSDQAWRLIIESTGHVQGKAFWMSDRTWRAMGFEWIRRAPFLYGVPVRFDPSMKTGVIVLERR